MPNEPAAAINFNTVIAIARWLMGHTAEANTIITLFGDWQTAPSASARIRVAAEIAKVLADIADDFPDIQPTFAAAPELAQADQRELQAEARDRGINWARLLAFVEKWLPIILGFLEPKPE